MQSQTLNTGAEYRYKMTTRMLRLKYRQNTATRVFSLLLGFEIGIR